MAEDITKGEDIRGILREGTCCLIVKGNYKWGLQHGISLGYSEKAIQNLFEKCIPFLDPLIQGTRAGIDDRVDALATLISGMMK